MKKLHVVGYSVMVGMLLATLIGYSRQNAKLLLEQQELRHRLNWIESSAQRLARGEGTLAIYSMTGTDELLSCFASRADVENVSLEVTDVGSAGIRSIASMLNVRSISFSGDLGVNDEALALLAECRKLAALELTCTKVTDVGIAQLEQFSSLRHLTLGEGIRPALTIDSINRLANLQQLETLRLNEWATVEIVDQLRAQLPGCRIVHRPPAHVADR